MRSLIIFWLIARSFKRLMKSIKVHWMLFRTSKQRTFLKSSKPCLKACQRTLKSLVVTCLNTSRLFHEALFRPIPTAHLKARIIFVNSLNALPLALSDLTISENGFYSNKFSQKQTKKLPQGNFLILILTHF